LAATITSKSSLKSSPYPLPNHDNPHLHKNFKLNSRYANRQSYFIFTSRKFKFSFSTWRWW